MGLWLLFDPPLKKEEVKKSRLLSKEEKHEAQKEIKVQVKISSQGGKQYELNMKQGDPISRLKAEAAKTSEMPVEKMKMVLLMGKKIPDECLLLDVPEVGGSRGVFQIFCRA